MLTEILTHKDVLEKPPVLIDVGASGEIHDSWKFIAKYSICIGFDADLRDFQIINDSTDYKKLILINKIVSDQTGVQKFYLTNSPHCSSTLDADLVSLGDYSFRDLFELKQTLELETTTIGDVLKSLKINYLDWFKTDSQGTDLRIYKNIDKKIRDKILVAEFEPGVVDAYKGEDKLYSIMEYMNDDFFIDDIIFKGSHRIDPKILRINFSHIRDSFFDLANKKSKLWAEVVYINSIKNKDKYDKRDFLILSAILISKKQYLFSIEISEYCIKRFNDNIFLDIKKYCVRKIYFRLWRLIYKIPYTLIKNIWIK